MINNSYYSQEVHGPYELHDIGNLELEEGGLRVTLIKAVMRATERAKQLAAG